MRKCLIYARTSTADQTTENQLRQLSQYAESQGWEVVDVVTDISSGSLDKSERKGLTRVFKEGHRKKFDILLFWSLDRLSREGSRKTISYLTQLENFGIDWHSYSEPYISSLGIFADAIISLLAALAKQERTRIAERTRAGMERARQNGATFGRPKTCETKIAEAVRLRERGLSYSKIGKEMGISSSRAHQLVNTSKETT